MKELPSIISSLADKISNWLGWKLANLQLSVGLRDNGTSCQLEYLFGYFNREIWHKWFGWRFEATLSSFWAYREVADFCCFGPPKTYRCSKTGSINFYRLLQLLSSKNGNQPGKYLLWKGKCYSSRHLLSLHSDSQMTKSVLIDLREGIGDQELHIFSPVHLPDRIGTLMGLLVYTVYILQTKCLFFAGTKCLVSYRFHLLEYQERKLED